MAVLRPDQTQLTFASEASSGADQDIICGDGVYNSTTLTAQANPGDLSLTVGTNGGDSFVIGDIIIIGGGEGNDEPYPAASATTSITQKEVRKVEHKEGDVLFFDRPLGFTHHVNNGSGTLNKVARLSTVDDTAALNNKLITYVPGVYETVDTPDPMMTIEPRYSLGTNAKRNFTSIYAGQQTYQGALSGCILLNGWPLRFPIGVEIPKAFGAVSTLANMGAASFLGDTWIKTGATSHGLTTSDYIIVDYIASPTMTTTMEIRKVRSIPSTNAWIELETPLRYAHATNVVLKKWTASSTNYVEHHIVERTDLDSISMHLHMRDSSETTANDFDRRWVGGKVGAMSIIGEEGGLVTVNWDSLIFKDMIHNQARHAATTRYDPTGTIVEGGTSIEPNMPGYAMMNDIVQADIQFPSTQPYYFSAGTISLFGKGGTAPTEFARIRSFAITVNNNEDQRYYITSRYGSHRGPSEIREQRREYTMSCTVALPDSQGASDNTIDNAASIFKELLLEGRYNATDMTGFSISLKFIRESSAFGPSLDDALYIDIPGPEIGATAFETAGTPNRPYATLGNQGAFLRSAPHTIMTESPFQVACDFLFRNIAIVVRDSEPVYP